MREGREAVELFAEIGDTWGETTASGPVVRALAELGRRSEAESALARMYQIARTLPSKGTSNIPSIVEGCILLQYGHADEAARVLQPIYDTADDMSNADLAAAHRADVPANRPGRRSDRDVRTGVRRRAVRRRRAQPGQPARARVCRGRADRRRASCRRGVARAARRHLPRPVADAVGRSCGAGADGW